MDEASTEWVYSRTAGNSSNATDQLSTWAAWPTCVLGRQQSPVNVITSDVATAPALDNGIIPHLKVAGQLLLKNTGVSFQVHEMAPELSVLPLGGGPPVAADPPSTKGYTMLRGQRFNWFQVHYHTPSENTIDGQHATLEAHYVHQLADEEYHGEGSLAGTTQHMAVVAVLYDLSKEDTCNEELSAFWEDFPTAAASEPGMGDSPGFAASSAPVDFGASLSRALAGGYYFWTGSLTTPPCTEGVYWALLKTRRTMCAAQLDRLHQALAASQRGVSVNNRATQPLNLRIITATTGGGGWDGGAAGAIVVLAIIGASAALCVLVALCMLLLLRQKRWRVGQRGAWASEQSRSMASTYAGSIGSGPSFCSGVSFGSSGHPSTAEPARGVPGVWDPGDAAIGRPQTAHPGLSCAHDVPDGGTEMQGGGLRPHRVAASRSVSFQGPPSIPCSPAHSLHGAARNTLAAASGITFLGHTTVEGDDFIDEQEHGGPPPPPSLPSSIATSPSGSLDDDGASFCRPLVAPGHRSHLNYVSDTAAPLARAFSKPTWGAFFGHS